MSVVGLITEYNPFHNGHLYHLQEAKRITGADTAVVIMSGSFVQRGTIAMIDKYTRTRMALEAGADLVIELPVCYAAASAEYFALGAVSILNKLGFVDFLVFGSECGDLRLLEQIADLYENEPVEVTQAIQQSLKTGATYPSARSSAVLNYLNRHKNIDTLPLEAVLNSPNNILGIEYLRALLRLHSTIQPFTIQRIQSDFHGENLSGSISSATAIRKALSDSSQEALSAVKDCVPDFAYQILEKNYRRTFPMVPNDLSLLLKYKLLSEDSSKLQQYLDLSPDLANRISRFKFSAHTFEELVNEIRSKQYTQTRIQRALLHILLEITTEDLSKYASIGYTPYARILGLRKSCSSYLKQTGSENGITIITKLSKANLEGPALSMLQCDIHAAHLYNLVASEKFKTELKSEYTHGLVLINDLPDQKQS